MLPRALVVLLAVAAAAESKRFAHLQKRETSVDICSQGYDNKIQCFCIQNGKEIESIISAECRLTAEDVGEEDPQWEHFQVLHHASRVVLSSTKSIALKYVPKKAISYLRKVQRLEIKYGKINEIKALSFGNISVAQISLSNNGIRILQENSFCNMNYLDTINLDKNEITEINRNVFHDLPSITKLFLTSNKITTIHDRAFARISNLKELELDTNSIFSLNSETFYGLLNLERLELSSNSLEVIGDDTFSALVNLKYLNLDVNKIEVLDPGAFRGVARLQQLSLARNQLAALGAAGGGVFAGLAALSSLSLQGNKLRQLDESVMAPVLSNFNAPTSKFDFQDNDFNCNCGLDWFLSLKNKTKNESLKLAIDNLNCRPDVQLSEAWKNLSENDKNNEEIIEDGLSQNQTNDYEYYDETQLDGKLFFLDIRDLLNCNKSKQRVIHNSVLSETTNSTVMSAKGSTQGPPIAPHSASSPHIPDQKTQATAKPADTVRASTIHEPSATPYSTTKVISRGVLNLADDESNASVQANKTIISENVSPHVKKHFTTNRMISVSARPDPPHGKINEERDMAADEAAPDELKAYQNIHEEAFSKESVNFKTNNANTNSNCVLTLILSLDLIGLFIKRYF